jgi:hypothetical protein
MRVRYQAGRIVSFSATLLLASLLAVGAAAAAEAATAPAQDPSACGNGLLDAAETCASCPADCKPNDCKTGSRKVAFDVDLAVPPARQPAAAGIRLAYRSSVLSLPGTGSDPAMRTRVSATPQGSFVAANDLGYAARIVVAKSGGFAPGRLFRIEFDLCAGAKAATSADLACLVEGCGSGAGQIKDCTCQAKESEAGN